MNYLPKVNIKKNGLGNPSLAIVHCMHGDEVVGKEIANNIFKLKINKGTLTTILANPKAYLKNKRFINEDLNRIFPGESKTYEQKLAKNILKIAKTVDYLVDIHSTTGKTPAFAIVISKKPKIIELLKFTGIKKIVLMGENLASGKSLIDQIENGFSLEYSSKTPKKSQDEGIEHMKSLLTGLEIIPGKKKKAEKLNFYEVFAVLKKPQNFKPKINFKNFSLIKKGTLLGFSKEEPIIADNDFYPIFYGEKAYSELICLQAVKK